MEDFKNRILVVALWLYFPKEIGIKLHPWEGVLHTTFPRV